MKKTVILFVIIGIVLVFSGFFICSLISSKQIDRIKSEETTFDALEKTQALENYFIDQYPISSVSKISNQDMLFFALTVLGTDANLTFSKTKLSNVLQKYFGSNISYKNEDIYLPDTKTVIYKYDSKKQEYIYQNVDNYSLNSKYYFISSSSDKTKKDVYQIEKQYLYIDNRTSNYVLYATFADYLNHTNSLGVIDTNSSRIDYTIMNQYKSEIKVIVYTFHREKGKYILKSIQ